MKRLTETFLLLLLLMAVQACQSNQQFTPAPVAVASPSPTVEAKTSTSQITLPLLDALLAQPAFVTELKTKIQITDDQVESLRRVANSEVQRLRAANAEQNNGDADDARTLAFDRISEIIGDDKAKQLASFADNFSSKSDEDAAIKETTGPNGVPTDTRVVVNIPAYRMDLFQHGTLIKSYKIGIGYPQFPLPQGLRKAQSIIFNPTWTPPDSPWVASMKDVAAGERVEAGSSLNPLGLIKIPIGMPSLIHGGKPISKIGKFASHGCVGLTNAQVKDFARLLLQASDTEVSDHAIAGFLANKTQTRVVKLSKTIPVELRYDTIVVEDGKLLIYKDVYDKRSNTEENLRKVLESAGVDFSKLTEEEKTQAANALTAMSKKAPAQKNQQVMVVELASLTESGYPAPVNLDTGSGTKTNALNR